MPGQRSSGLAIAVAYVLNHDAGLRLDPDAPAVPIHNYEAEIVVLPPVLGRSDFQGWRSQRNTEVNAILSTLVESAKRRGVSLEAYLLAAAKNALMQAMAVLLPDDFKRQFVAFHLPPLRAS